MRLRAPLALLTLLAAVLSGLVGTGTSATAADPLAGAPAIGHCYDATYRQVQREALDEPTVACTAPHTLAVVGLGQLPAGVDWSAPDSRLEKVSSRICDPAWKNAYGADPRRAILSNYLRVWFTPTPAQREAGARWVSCEVGLISDRKLVTLPETLVPVTRHPDDSIARCGTTSYDFVTCSEKHAYRTTTSFVVRARGTADVLRAAAERAAARRCPRLVDSPRDWMWSWAGNTATTVVVGCLTHTRR